VRMQVTSCVPTARGHSTPKGRGRQPAYPVVLVVLLASLAGCSHSASLGTTTTSTTRPAPGTGSDPVAPSLYSVRAGRFVESVEVGDKTLVVSPPPKTAIAQIGEVRAASLFDADYSFQGIYQFDLLGLGSATVDAQPQETSYYLKSAPDVASTTTTKPVTTTTRPPPTTTTTTTAPAPTTTAPAPTTTSPGPTTTTTAPPPTTTTTSPSTYDKRLAWVGIAVGQKPSCAGGTASVIAIVIDAYTGNDVVQVEVRGGCHGSGSPAVSHPYELESVPWSPVGQASTAVVVRLPDCGIYVGWTVLDTGSGPTQVQAAVPYDPSCGTTAHGTKIIDLVVPLGSGRNSPPHAAIGQIDNLQVLP
jgi:hypothetical protein